jgi:hypothetical protein
LPGTCPGTGLPVAGRAPGDSRTEHSLTPHFILLVFLSIAAVVVLIISWFAILFTGALPRRLFDFVFGVLRWGNRVTAYAFVLVTDQYPALPA